MQPQLLRRAAAQEHAVHEDLKILDHRAHLRVDGERETDLLVGERDLVLFDGVVDAVVDVEGGASSTAGAASSSVLRPKPTVTSLPGASSANPGSSSALRMSAAATGLTGKAVFSS